MEGLGRIGTIYFMYVWGSFRFSVLSEPGWTGLQDFQDKRKGVPVVGARRPRPYGWN